MSLVAILTAFIKGKLIPGQIIIDKKGVEFEVLSKDKLRVSVGKCELILSLPVIS
jgi:hypothetical protein